MPSRKKIGPGAARAAVRPERKNMKARMAIVLVICGALTAALLAQPHTATSKPAIPNSSAPKPVLQIARPRGHTVHARLEQGRHQLQHGL